MTASSTASAAPIRHDRRWGALFIVIAMNSAWAGAQVPTYLAEVGSDAAVTRGASRLLHDMPGDVPILVNIETPPGEGGTARREAVVRALKRWEQAAPDLLSFLVVAQCGPDVLHVDGEPLHYKVGSYRYSRALTTARAGRYP